MRKGTHSCLECRQRKVRCVGEPNAHKCNGCAVRELQCTDQMLHIWRSPDSQERETTRDRVEALERRLDQVLRQQSIINENIRSPEHERMRIEPSEISQQAGRDYSVTDSGNDVSRKRRRVAVLASHHADAGVPKTQVAGDRPIIELFEDVEIAKRRSRNAKNKASDDQAGPSVADESAHCMLRALRLQMPNSPKLESILQAGVFMMGLWSGAFPETLGTADSLSIERLQNHIYRCLYSDSIADGAKLMLCLALHLQQLPTDFKSMYINLPAPLDALQDYYITSAEDMLASDNGFAATVDGLQCMILQSEYYINIGSLRKVWLITRRAISLAQLLGLHRKIDAGVESSLAMRGNAIWADLWQRERGFSLILGLPHSTLDSQLPPLTPENDVSDLQKQNRFLRDLGMVMGYIIGRDQDPNGKAYSVTLKIEEQLEECQSIMPAQWWDYTPGPTTPTDMISSMFVAKMRFHTVQRLLHLPFLLKASGDRKYESSRLTTLKSSREIINVYNVLRDERRPVLKMCDMADFQVFAAAMTLMIDLLTFSRTPNTDDPHQEERDWQLVLRTTVKLRNHSRSMSGCNVAALGAQVLEDFSNLRYESVEGTSKVDIPYFGRIEIRQSDPRRTKHASSSQVSSAMHHETQSRDDAIGIFDGSMESIVSPDSYFFPLSAASPPWQVADESWAHMLDSTMADDWNWSLGGD